MKAWQAILAALVIFGAGLVTGGVSVKLAQSCARPNPPPRSFPPGPGWSQRFELLQRMERQLNLTPEQHAKIERIIQESQERMKAMWDPIASLAHAESQQMRERILAELNPEQKAKFEQLLKAHAPRGRDAAFTNEPNRHRERRGPPWQTPGDSSSRPTPPNSPPATNPSSGH